MLESIAEDNISWQHLKVLILFQQLLVSDEFSNFLLFHDNGTVDLTADILQLAVEQVDTNHNIIVYNIDIPMAKRPDEKLAVCFARSVSVELYTDHNSRKLILFRTEIYRLRIRTHWIRVYLGEMGDSQRFYNVYRYMAVIEMIENEALRIYTYNYQQRERMHLFRTWDITMYAQLFRDQRIDMRGKPLYMWGNMDAPNLFRAIAFDAHGQEVRGMSGFYAAIGRMVGKYFNTTVQFAVQAKTKTVSLAGPGSGPGRPPPNSGDSYPAYERMRKRYYRAQTVEPKVEKSRVVYDLYDEFQPTGHAMYPHRQENYVVLVPTQREPPPKLWVNLLASPLTTMWLIAIVIITALRCAVRAMERLGTPVRMQWDDLQRITVETCGMSFGWAMAVSRAGRAEQVLLVFVSLFSICLSVFCSGLLLQQFTFSGHTEKINTLADLYGLSNMTMVLPMGLGLSGATWNPNHTLVHTSLHAIYGEILERNTRCSFVLPESVADVLLAEEHMNSHEGPLFHKLSERIFSTHMSLYTTHTIIEHNLNDLMQRFVNQGLIHHIETKTRMALSVRVQQRKQPPNQETGEASSVTLNEIWLIMIVVFIGQMGSIAVFGVEWMMRHRVRN